jgi:hypothetical protein
MKKQLLLISAVILTAGTLVFTGCKKDDTAPPTVTVTGANPMYISLNGTYAELGATATDEEDGTVTATPSGTVDVDAAGTYTITYTATDAAGNTGTAKRTVIVSNDAANYAGTYTGVDTSPYPGTAGAPFTVSITASSSVNNVLLIQKFANYANAIVSVYVSGGTVTLVPASQTVTAGSPALAHTFTQLSTPASTATTSGNPVITIYYHDSYNNGGPQDFDGQTVYTKQ